MLLLALLAWAGSRALGAAEALEQVDQRLRAAQRAEADVDEARAALVDARALLTDAADDVESPPVRIAARLPVLGRSFAAERAVVRTSAAAVDGLLLVAEQAERLGAGPGRVDVARLTGLAAGLEKASGRAQTSFAALRRSPTALTPGRVSAGVERAERGLEPVVGTLRKAALGADVAVGLLGGQGGRAVLVALENNAELRGTGGYVSTFATGTFADGRMALEPFRDVAEVRDQPETSRPVDAPREFVEDYGSFLAHTTHFRNWTMSADIPASAAVGAAAAGALLGTMPDVVVLLDVPALGAIVRLQGTDIRLDDGTSLSATELEKALLADEYERGGDEQFARRAALRAAATRTVATLLDDPAPSLETLRTLGRLAEGRHFALWSARPDEQAQLVELGLAGEVDPGPDDLALVSLNNLNGSKLDSYLDRTLAVDVTVGAENSRAVQRLTLRNTAPEGLVPYVEGTANPGEVYDRVEFWLAPDAVVESFEVNGEAAPLIRRRRADHTLIATNVRLARGQSVVVEVTYAVPTPGGAYRVALVPQALARDARLELAMRPAAGGTFAEVDGPGRQADGTVRWAEPWTVRRVVAATLG